MFAEERHQRILDALTRHGRVEVAALARDLGVSEDTVRRDLKALTEKGFLQKTHGGAVLLATAQIRFPARTAIRPAAKAGLGAAAAALVEAHQTIFIDAGTTTLELARALEVTPLCVVTNSLDVATVLADRPGIDLVLSGGLWCAPERYFAGPTAVALIASHRADMAFLGACAVHAKLGVTATHASDAQVKAAMIAHSASAVLVTDDSKFGQIAPYSVAALSDFDRLITDSAPDWLLDERPYVQLVPA
ncbi:DeoR/GlpR transcriptional regulator [Chitinimonas arctica]|uniref:DeoR/GlpR transcriptional regulator n=1 Tax=Chitinimonas arctica TaxID=2594795 RepID=A0A516SFB1_9NEIS|nr:DeoR/GlpR family DNA-binding transcription regulator [Chitinimonas arctica]QDQ26857.1 DeoR/GlpR transcriptional regulator [Chitinimonas arctica]